jgi:hypothetical protein
MYFKLQKYHSKTVSVVCVIAFWVYSRENIEGVSYYSLNQSFFLMSQVLLYDVIKALDEDKSRRKEIQLIFAGILMALAVMANPFLAVPYILIVVSSFILFKYTKKYLKYEFYYILGGCIVFLAFIVYVFNNISLNDFLVYFPYMMSDPGHSDSKSIEDMVWGNVNALFFYSRVICVFSVILLLRSILKKCIPINRVEFNIYLLFIFVMYIYGMYESLGLIGKSYLAVVGVLVPIVVLYGIWKDIDNWVIIFTFYVPGIILAFCWGFASDTGISAMCIGHMVGAIGVFLIVDKVIAKEKSGIIKLGMMICIILPVLITGYLKVAYVYRDDELSNLTQKITTGPAKGLYTSSTHKEEYDTLYTTIINELPNDNSKNVFFSKLCPWAYLCTDMKCAAPSTWRYAIDSSRMDEYLEINKERMPDYVFVLDKEYGNSITTSWRSQGKDEFPNENEYGGRLYDYMISSKNTRETLSGTIYEIGD